MYWFRARGKLKWILEENTHSNKRIKVPNGATKLVCQPGASDRLLCDPWYRKMGQRHGCGVAGIRRSFLPSHSFPKILGQISQVPGQAAKFFRCFFWFRPLLWLLQGTRWCAATELSTPTPIQEHGQQARCWAQDASCKSQRGVVSVWLSSSLRSLTHLSHWCFEMTHPPFPLLPCPA